MSGEMILLRDALDSVDHANYFLLSNGKQPLSLEQYEAVKKALKGELKS